MAGGRTGSEAERAAGQGQGEGGDQADGARADGPCRRSEFPAEDERARRDESGGNGIAQRTEHEPGAPDRAVAEGATGPVGVGHAAQEDPDRDQGQGDDVDVMGLEDRTRQGRPAGQQGALRALGRCLTPRCGLLRGFPGRGLALLGGGHVRTGGFDGHAAPPAMKNR